MYVYALADTVDLPEGVRGWQGAPLVPVDAGVCLAITAEVMETPLPAPDTLRGQDMVVRALMFGSAALLPARFGTVVTDLAALRARLAPDRAGVQRALALVRHREQMTLRLVARDAGRVIGPAESATGATSPGRRYLERRAAELAPPAVLVRLESDLAPFIRHARLQHGREPGRVTTAYHLIDRGEGDAYRARVERCAAAIADVAVLVTGPGPAYAFADISGS
jgi:hypothetical protein